MQSYTIFWVTFLVACKNNQTSQASHKRRKLFLSVYVFCVQMTNWNGVTRKTRSILLYCCLRAKKVPNLLTLKGYNIPWLKKITWVTGVLRRTVVINWRFDNLTVWKPSSESSGSVSRLKIQKPWWAIWLVKSLVQHRKKKSRAKTFFHIVNKAVEKVYLYENKFGGYFPLKSYLLFFYKN